MALDDMIREIYKPLGERTLLEKHTVWKYYRWLNQEKDVYTSVKTIYVDGKELMRKGEMSRAPPLIC